MVVTSWQIHQQFRQILYKLIYQRNQKSCNLIMKHPTAQLGNQVFKRASLVDIVSSCQNKWNLIIKINWIPIRD